MEVNPRFSARYRCGEPLAAKRSLAEAANAGISVSSALQLKASPNPFTENLIVSLGINGKLTSENPADYSVEWASTNGTVLQSQRLQHFSRKLNFQTGQYPPGSYVVMLKNKAGQIQSLQVVKLNR